MPKFALQGAKQTLRQKLLRCMLALAGLVLFALAAGLFLFGRLNSPEEELARTLDMQLEFFQNEMTSCWKQLTVMGIDLSEDMTNVLEDYLSAQGISFGALRGDQAALEAVQDAMIEPVCEHLRQTDCSGAFVILETSTDTDVTSHSRSGLYIIKGGEDLPNAELLLYRGAYSIGKQHGVMAHRKWRGVFQTDGFAGYESLIQRASLPLSGSYRLTELMTLPETDEKVILLTVPVMGEDGTVYGLCGFQISQRYFKTKYVQPSNLPRMVCLLTMDGKTLNADAGLSCGISNGYYLAPKGELTVHGADGEFCRIDGPSASYMGMTQRLTLSCGDVDYRLAAMIPQEDYDDAVFKSRLQFAILTLLLLFFAVATCLYFSRRFLTPVLKGLEALKREDRGAAQADLAELAELSSHLAAQDQKHIETLSALEQEKQDAKRAAEQLAYSRKSEIDPEEYRHFAENIDRLSGRERELFELYCEGKKINEMADLLGIKPSTVKFHNQNICDTLGLKNIAQLRRYAAVMRQAGGPDAVK